MKVLVVVDMQGDFISGALGSKEAQEIVPKVVQKINNFDGVYAVTHDTHYEDYLNTQEGRLLPVVHCSHLSDGWELHKDVYEAIDAKVTKEGKDAEVFLKGTFGSIELADWLAQMNKKSPIEEITLVGLCTDICVISNAMLIKAFLPEVKLSVDAACCAGVTPESHANALAAMKMCQINIENWEA